MNLKDNLCKAFCGTLTVNSVPAGYAVGTGHQGSDGDHIGFYVIGPSIAGTYHLQDDGLSMAFLEAAGVDLANKSRQAMFSDLREQYGVMFDAGSGELKSAEVESEQVGAEALRFMAFMLRVQDLVQTTNERTLSTFKEEAAKIIREIAAGRAQVIDDFVVNENLTEIHADLGIVAPNRPPVAVFFGTSEAHVMEALLLQSWAENKKIDCAVIVLLETDTAITQKVRQRANNHLEAVPSFRGDEQAACKRIVREAIGFDPTTH